MGKMHAEGVTLIELMVTVMVLAVVLAAGIPTFADFLRNNRMSAAVNDVVTSLHLARSEAVKRRTPVTICPAASATECDAGSGIESGWLVFVDTNGNGIPEGPGDSIIQIRPSLPTEIADYSRWGDENGDATGRFLISFDPSGYLLADIDGTTPVANLQFCDKRGDQKTIGGSAAGRWVEITRTGRPRVFASREQVQASANPLGGCP